MLEVGLVGGVCTRVLAKVAPLIRWRTARGGAQAVAFELVRVRSSLSPHPVPTPLQVVNVTGNQDICYYNFLCAHPSGQPQVGIRPCDPFPVSR